MTRAVREGLKTALIAALLALAVLTARATGMFSEVIAAVADSSPSGAAYIGNSGGAVSAEAARPCAIVV
ncbi:MAG: hypothetical protein LBK23_12325, partial [Oscillospiraceae bacterium]|nr:hypothetical protein [Oscillospiraceae bacterium]